MYAPSFTLSTYLRATLRSHLNVGRGVCVDYKYIYYYTPLPLNLANKQANKQASNKQALLLSVLAIAPPHRSGLYSSLAILEPRWWPCQIQVLSQKLTSCAPGRRRQVGRCPPKNGHFVPQSSLFWPKTAPIPSQNGQTKANGSYTTRAPRFPRDQEPFRALQLHNMSEKRPKNGQKWPKCALFVSNRPKTKNGPYLGLRGSKPNSEGTYPTRNPPLFVVSKLRNRPTRRLDPRTSGHLLEPEGSTARANGGSTGVPGAKKITFSKVVPRPLGMLKQVFLGRFEPVVARYGPWKIPKCLENGTSWDQTGVKTGSKSRFSKNDPGPLGMLKQVFSAHFEPVVTCFGPWKIPKCLENGSFRDQKRVKSGSKTRFSKSDPRPFGMLKQVVLAHFEPIGTGFGPCKIPKCLEKRPFWEQKWVKNGSKTGTSKSDPVPLGVHKQVKRARFEPVLIDFSPFRHVHAPRCTFPTYLRAVQWSHLELGRGV